MKNVIMWISEHYIRVSIMLGLLLGLIVNLNYSVIYKEDGKIVCEGTIGPVTERAEYGDGFIGKYIIDNKEVYTITLK